MFNTDQFKSGQSLKFFNKTKMIDRVIQTVKDRNHVNGLEGFWPFAEERLLKYHAIDNQYFPFYFKELEFRYNHGKENIYELMAENHFGPDFN